MKPVSPAPRTDWNLSRAGVIAVYALLLPNCLWCQWTGGPSGPIYYTGGNVGIGTASPAYLLDTNGTIRSQGGSAGLIFGPRTGSGASFQWYDDFGTTAKLWSSTNGDLLGISSSGYVGIGTASPNARLEVTGSAAVAGSTAAEAELLITRPGTANVSFPFSAAFALGRWDTTTAYPNARLDIRLKASADMNYVPDVNVMSLLSNGNVAIGTTNPGTYRLAVEGNIGTRDVVVTNVPWSDYVFRPGYRLRPLSEVNTYIQSHHHLPEIPTEAEVKEHGVSVGEMQAKLLAKIEELTLHMIQADERNNSLERQNQELRDRITRLENVQRGRHE